MADGSSFSSLQLCPSLSFSSSFGWRNVTGCKAKDRIERGRSAAAPTTLFNGCAVRFMENYNSSKKDEDNNNDAIDNNTESCRA